MAGYKRILLKLSGEALMGEQKYGIDPQRLADYANDIKMAVSTGVQMAIVIGGGNIFRGLKGTGMGFDRVKGDYMGMLATVINGLALQSALESAGLTSRLFTAIRMEPFAEFYNRNEAIKALENGNVIILTGGTGNPFFTTDTASALRAVEIKANVMIKGTRVDGVFDSDPEKNASARMFHELTFNEAIRKQLNVMDSTAFTMCRENNLPVVVFNMNVKDNLRKLISGEKIGTLIKN
jgi:uridylate kinase